MFAPKEILLDCGYIPLSTPIVVYPPEAISGSNPSYFVKVNRLSAEI
jgi:hypothetical protein